MKCAPSGVHRKDVTILKKNLIQKSRLNWILDISFVLLREKMDDITRLFDVVLPVLHKVLQRYQRVFHYWHHVFRGPGFHGNQYNPRVQLFLVDLRTINAHQSTVLLAYTCAVNAPYTEIRTLSGIQFPNTHTNTHTLF